MSILSRLSALFNRNEDVQKTGTEFIKALAAEAISSGDPAALAEVAATWEALKTGESLVALPSTSVAGALPANSSLHCTAPQELRPHVLAVMRNNYANGKDEVTTGEIQKGVNALMVESGGWKDGDMEDVDPRQPGIQHRWKRILSDCLRDMRAEGIIANDASRWKTYRLCRTALPPSSNGAKGLEDFDPEPAWQVLA